MSSPRVNTCCLTSNSAVATIGTATLLFGLLVAAVGAVAMVALKMGPPSSNFLVFGNAIGNYGAIAMMSAGGLSTLVGIACASILIRNLHLAKQRIRPLLDENHQQTEENTKSSELDQQNTNQPEPPKNPENTDQKPIDTADVMKQLFDSASSNSDSFVQQIQTQSLIQTALSSSPIANNEEQQVQQSHIQTASSSPITKNEEQQVTNDQLGSDLIDLHEFNHEISLIDEQKRRMTEECIKKLPNDDLQAYGKVLRQMPINSYKTYSGDSKYTILLKGESGQVEVKHYQNILSAEQIQKNTEDHIEGIESEETRQAYGEILRQMPMCSFKTYSVDPNHFILWKDESGQVSVKKYDYNSLNRYINHLAAMKKTTINDLTNLHEAQ